MSTRKILQEALDIMNDIYKIVNNINWRDYSETRVKILVTKKTDELKHILSELPDEDIFSSDEASNFFEKILDRITRILGNLPPEKMPLQWYELELWRLRYASMYALQWGHGGELQVAGTAHALANVLIGIQTMDVQDLIVDWEHPEFEKRRKLILNYLNSAYLFFFSLSTSLNLIYKHDIEHWLSEGIKASIQYLKYLDHFWNVPKNIQLEKKKHKNVRDPNYSPYYATFAGIDYIISFLLDLQKYFFRDNLKIDSKGEIINLNEPEKFLVSLENLIDRGEFYIKDFKKHVDEGFFDINEDPLNDPDIKETIYELYVSKIWIKGLIAINELLINENEDEINSLVETVIPELFNYIDKYKHLFNEEDFIHSQIADGINSILNEVILFSGVLAIRTGEVSDIEKIETDYAMFFTEEAMKRYPTINGLFNTFKITNSIIKDDLVHIEKYALNLIQLSEYTLYEPRNSFSYSLLGNMILLILGSISKEDFLKKVRDKFEYLLPSFSEGLISEIEIYLTNLNLSLNSEQSSIDVSRLLNPQYFDPYSIFIPEISKLAKKLGFEDIVYLPFNLQKDFLADSNQKIIEQIDTAIEQTESKIEQQDTSSD
ncbi:MAG: hypothetical protein H7645_08420 [Candidatus Heimdallarchaeota archaeon]|nr:hypothetical protein [Candidatus Heimdallarchaeota archaeon]MCK4770349.1 hypothetical protein [Candidatus Heimdallarchaeota archaeon]